MCWILFVACVIYIYLKISWRQSLGSDSFLSAPLKGEDHLFAWKGLHSLGILCTWKERDNNHSGKINKRAPKCPSIDGKLERKENITGCSYKLMHSISRAALYSKILFSPYLLWKDSLFCNATRVINAYQLKAFRLLRPNVLYFCASEGPVCICWTIRERVRRGFSDAGSEKEEWKMERMVGSQPVCMAQSWSGWGSKGETRDGEKVKTLQKGLKVWTWTSLKAASLQNWNFEARVFNDLHIYKLLVIVEGNF